MKKIIIFLGVFLFGFFNENMYDLMYKSFVYNKDLKNAYLVAKKALKYEKDSIKWRRRVADTSLWLGNIKSAYRNYMFIYKETKSKKIEKILFKFNYPFKALIKLKIKVYLREFKRGNFKNSIKLAYIYYSMGDVKKAENILKTAYEKTKDEKFFYWYIKYALLAEDMSIIKKNLKHLKYETVDNKIKIAYMLININDFKDAYDILVYVNKIPKNIKYYKLLIYVSYQLRDFKNLLKLLNYMYDNSLMDKRSFSLFLSYYYSIHDYTKLENILSYAINKFHFNVYKDYINVLIMNDKYKKALLILEKYKNKFTKKEYYKLKAYLYYKLKDYDEAEKFYEKLLKFHLNENELNEILWFCINNNDYRLFNKIKSKISNHYALVLAYLTFFKVDKAYEEMSKVKLDSLDKYLTYINILDIRGVDSYKYKLKAFNLANYMLQNNPKLLNNPDFFKNYINLAGYFFLPDRMRKLFKIAKKVLNKQDYLEVKISYYFQLSAYDKLYYIKNYKRDFK